MDEMLAATMEDKPDVVLLREEFLERQMKDVDKLIRESNGDEDFNARQLWSQARKKIVKPFSLASQIGQLCA